MFKLYLMTFLTISISSLSAQQINRGYSETMSWCGKKYKISIATTADDIVAYHDGSNRDLFISRPYKLISDDIHKNIKLTIQNGKIVAYDNGDLLITETTSFEEIVSYKEDEIDALWQKGYMKISASVHQVDANKTDNISEKSDQDDFIFISTHQTHNGSSKARFGYNIAGIVVTGIGLGMLAKYFFTRYTSANRKKEAK